VEKDIPFIENSEERPKDNFYHGVISKIFWSNETGVIHSDSGKEIPFIFAFVTLLGAPRQDINFLRPGMRVGFDVGWTSKGLRASIIKIYDLYQDDIALEENGAGVSAESSDPIASDHPISRYRPPEIHDAAEPPRYRQRRSRPRSQPQESRPQTQTSHEQNRQEAHPPKPEFSSDGRMSGQQQSRPHGRPAGQEQRRPEPRTQGQEQRRPDRRQQGQEQRRSEPRHQMPGQHRGDARPQGQRREEQPRSSAPQNTRPPDSAQKSDTTAQPTDERSRRSRRRRGRR